MHEESCLYLSTVLKLNIGVKMYEIKQKHHDMDYEEKHSQSHHMHLNLCHVYSNGTVLILFPGLSASIRAVLALFRDGTKWIDYGYEFVIHKNLTAFCIRILTKYWLAILLSKI